MVNIKTKEISVQLGYNLKSQLLDDLINKWLEANTDIILDIIDIKYHTQMTDNNSESSALVIYKTK